MLYFWIHVGANIALYDYITKKTGWPHKSEVYLKYFCIGFGFTPFKLIYHAVLFTSVAAGSKAIANLISENKEHLIST